MTPRNYFWPLLAVTVFACLPLSICAQEEPSEVSPSTLTDEQKSRAISFICSSDKKLRTGAYSAGRNLGEDGKEVYRNEGEGDNYPEPMFAILNYAKITDSAMTGEWVMEVDWVKHESRN